MIDWIAGAVSAAGLVGIYHKRAWGPLVCGVASTVWFGIAVGDGRIPWAAVEACWATSGFITAWHWRGDTPEKRIAEAVRRLRAYPGCYGEVVSVADMLEGKKTPGIWG